MNFSTLVSSVVFAFAISSTASAQWAGGGSGLSVGIGGSYNKVTLPNGQRFTSNSLNWGVGLGASQSYGMGYGGYGGYGMGYGGYGMGYGGWGCGPSVLPYYGGGCVPAVVPYSPFTRCYATPMYTPQFPCAPAAVLPQAAICW